MEVMRFDGKVAVVTGAARGLGRAYALQLASRGATVVVNDRPPDAGAQDRPGRVVDEIVTAGGKAIAGVFDVSSPDGAQALVDLAVQQLGRVDVLVNNAGIAHGYPFRAYPDDEFNQMIATNLGGAWHTTRAAWDALADSGDGRVVNTVSRAAYIGDPQNAAYATSKGAVHGLTRALAAEGRPVGIKVNAICPVAWTPLYESVSEGMPEDRKSYLRDNFSADLVAPVVVALAHSDCPCTGEILNAMGGRVARYFVAETQGMTFEGALHARSVHREPEGGLGRERVHRHRTFVPRRAGRFDASC